MHSGVTVETFASLHEGLARYFLDALKNPESPVGLIKEAREFLKDNGIDGVKTKGSSLEQLAAKLPHFEQDEEQVPLRLVK